MTGELRPDADPPLKKQGVSRLSAFPECMQRKAGQQVIQKNARIFRTMRMLSENPKKACIFSDFAVKYNVHYSVPARKEALIASAMHC